MAALRNFNKVRSPSESSKELNTVLSDRDKSCIHYLGGRGDMFCIISIISTEPKHHLKANKQCQS